MSAPVRASALDHRVPPPLVAILTGAAMGAVSLLTPSIHVLPLVRFGIVGLLLLFGGLFGRRAFAAFGRVGTTINPVRIEQASVLVTTGIYSVSRNPMYVALTTLLVTMAVFLSRPWLLVGPLVFVAFITRFQILPEERFMQAKFGTAYTAYKDQVRRWL